jgi:hypothetical protein
MTDHMSFLRRWKGRATSRKSDSKNNTQTAGDHANQAVDQQDDHQHGAEGHAFQVNGEPEKVDDQSDNTQ